ncbi:hypothetical protein HYW17_00485 [Candidatus Uhrbacteria bacterium]|nr:hypothetical protein [Candidatus Uhrbacteria bacterium]
MDRHAQKVFLAVAIGVGLGILAGRALGGALAWMLGAALGGASAYVLFAPIAALRAIPRAYRAARGKWPNAERWEMIRWNVWAALAPMTTILVFIALLEWSDPEAITAFKLFGRVVFFTTVFGSVFWVFMASIAMYRWPSDLDKDHEGQIVQLRYRTVHALLPVLVFWHTPRLLGWIAFVAIPGMVTFSLRLAKQWVILIHSDIRMICLADAFLFAGIGTLVGGPILAWMAGGGAFGVLNYRIVSVRLLKLKPVRSAK